MVYVACDVLSGTAGVGDDEELAEVAWSAGQAPLAYVCGPTSFVEAVAGGLVGLGYPPRRVDSRLVYNLYDEWKKQCGVGRLVDLDALARWCREHNDGH